MGSENLVASQEVGHRATLLHSGDNNVPHQSHETLDKEKKDVARGDSERSLAKKQGQANPSEFPWGCLVLDQSNNFVGSCAIIPDNRFNDVRSGTDRVVTAAHKLKNHRNTQLKIRVIEYDAGGFKNTENTRHQEYQVSDIEIHPQYDSDPLMSSRECGPKLEQALGRDAGRNFRLSPSEICAGGEQNKDACDGDGGAPLVCESKEFDGML